MYAMLAAAARMATNEVIDTILILRNPPFSEQAVPEKRIRRSHRSGQRKFIIVTQELDSESRSSVSCQASGVMIAGGASLT